MDVFSLGEEDAANYTRGTFALYHSSGFLHDGGSSMVTVGINMDKDVTILRRAGRFAFAEVGAGAREHTLARPSGSAYAECSLRSELLRCISRPYWVVRRGDGRQRARRPFSLCNGQDARCPSAARRVAAVSSKPPYRVAAGDSRHPNPPNPVNPVETETLRLFASALRGCFSNYRNTQRDFGGKYCSVLQYFWRIYCRTRQYLIQYHQTRRYCHA